MKKLLMFLNFALCFNINAQVFFSSATNFAVGTTPKSMISGDFNGDGIKDLAVANYNSNNVSILLGTVDGNFSTATNFPTGPLSISLISADFNGDSKIDLAVANRGADNVSVLLGTGTGSFGVATNFVVGSEPFSIISTDFNGDGENDLAIACNGTNSVSVLLGTGTGSFGVATNFYAGSNPVFIYSADFNGDMKADLVVVNIDVASVSVLLGTGTGSFGPATPYTVHAYPLSVTSADFNSDGKADLAVTNNGSNDVSVLLGMGTGSFGTATNFAVGIVPTAITSADFNGDGKADLATANCGGGVSVLLGTGTGSFGTMINYTAGSCPRSVISEDFNGDGKVDLGVANNDSNDVSILLSNLTTHTNVLCNGQCTGTATATTSGGQPPYTFLWTPGGQTTATVTDICAGTYTYTVTDSIGSTITSVITITQPTPLLLSEMHTNLCDDQCTGSVTLTTTGGNPPYTFSGATSGLCAGTYTYIVTDANGCTAITTATITHATEIIVSVSAENTSTFISSSTNLLTGTPDGGTFSGIGVYGTNFNPSIAGIGTWPVTYTYTDVNGCTDSAIINITVDMATGIAASAGEGAALEIYPNPTSGIFTVNSKNKTTETKICVYDALGKCVVDQVSKNDKEKIDLTNLPKGIYTLEIESDGGNVMKKIVLQ